MLKIWVFVAGFAMALVIAGALVALMFRAPKAHWTGTEWTCPAGYDVVADESEAIAGKDSAHCVR